MNGTIEQCGIVEQCGECTTMEHRWIEVVEFAEILRTIINDACEAFR